MRGVMTGVYRRFVGLRVVRAAARHRLRRLMLVGVPRTELDAWRVAQAADRFRGPRGTIPAIGLEDVYAFQAAYQPPPLVGGPA